MAEVFQWLSSLKSEDDYLDGVGDFIDALMQSGLGLEAVEPILRFMEEHADWDLGSPGPLVHFVEGFYGRGYEALLLGSIERKPTPYSAWMLNRVINGEKDSRRKLDFIEAMRKASSHAAIDAATVQQLNEFLALHL